jgi:hypothetical protein
MSLDDFWGRYTPYTNIKSTAIANTRKIAKLSSIVVHERSTGDSTMAAMCTIPENAVYHRSSPITRMWYGIANAVAATATGNGDGRSGNMREAMAQKGMNVLKTCQTLVSSALSGRNMPYIIDYYVRLK